jgi:hypothetical protein
MLDAILAHERGEEKNCTGDNKGQRLTEVRGIRLTPD